MAFYFFDANAIVKYFHSESGSQWIRNLVDTLTEENQPAHTIIIASISIAEVPAAFAILERTLQIGKQTRDTFYDAFLNAVEGKFQLAPILTTILYDAAELTRHYPLKGYDAVQFAVARQTRTDLLSQEVELILVTSDKQITRAAQAEGLQVENPLWHDDTFSSEQNENS